MLSLQCAAPARKTHHPTPARAGDYRDLVIEELVSAEADLTDQLVAARSDKRAYRLALQQAIHALHAKTRECARLRERLSQLTDEHRSLRERILREGGVAS